MRKFSLGVLAAGALLACIGTSQAVPLTTGGPVAAALQETAGGVTHVRYYRRYYHPHYYRPRYYHRHYWHPPYWRRHHWHRHW